MTDPYWHLTNLDLLSGVDDAEIRRAFGDSVIVRKHARRKSVVIEEGAGVVHGMLEGLAKVVHTTPSGRRLVRALLRPGDLFGQFMDPSGPRTRYTLETISAATLATIPADRLRTFVSSRPELVLTVVQILEDRSRRLSRQVEALVFKDVHSRVVETLLQLAVDIPESCPYGMALDLRVSQSDLAELVGASRQAVNRVLRNLEALDILHRHGRVMCIPNLQSLASQVHADPE
jgi:CRP/FNR family transcriptional regulator, cyclic AMP receptor protein